ncbi:MAG: HAD-IA family hydrolase [Armatimonadetes bacterium]|nr:HAD-IA family hydrolase [Armatimonadota bacterium]
MSGDRFAAVQVLLFDAGDTLIAYRRPLRVFLQDFLMERGIVVPRDGTAQALEAVAPRYQRLRGGCRTVEDERMMWEEIARALMADVAPDRPDLGPELSRWFVDNWRLHKVYRDVRPALTGLRRRGYRLGVVSNWEPSLPVLLEQLSLDDYFEAVVVSSVEGVWKPDPRLFHAAMDRFGVPPSTAASIGDDPARDVDAAVAAGLHGILLDRFDVHPRAGSVRIKSLQDLLALFPPRRY